jgi:hypothetical protein
MSYGIEITGSDGSTTFQVLDSDLNSDNYQVVATGSASTIDISSSAYGGSTGQARIFIKPQSGGPTTADISGSSYSFYRYNTTEDGSGNVIEATRTAISVSYVIIKDIANTPVNSSQGTYGIQVFKSNGDPAFDSRRFNTNESFRLLGVVAIGTVTGDPLAAGATLAGPSADVLDYYFEASSFYHQTGSTSGNVQGFERLGSGSGTVIRNAGYFWNEGDGSGGRGGQNLTFYFSNRYPIVYGELR